MTALMWAMWRRVDPSVFGQERVTVQFEFTDQPRSKRFWWLVNEGANVELCPKDPGFEVDLFVLADLETMIEIWVGRLALSTAIEGGRLECSGSHELCQDFRSWLLLSPLAQKRTAGPGGRQKGPGLVAMPKALPGSGSARRNGDSRPTPSSHT